MAFLTVKKAYTDHLQEKAAVHPSNLQANLKHIFRNDEKKKKKNAMRIIRLTFGVGEEG